MNCKELDVKYLCSFCIQKEQGLLPDASCILEEWKKIFDKDIDDRALLKVLRLIGVDVFGSSEVYVEAILKHYHPKKYEKFLKLKVLL